MKTSKNTILITGGGSGIGFETAKLFVQKGNTVIITGRNKEKLAAAAKQLGNIHYIQSDVTDPDQVDDLVKTVKRDFPSLNVLMNNAGLANLYQVGETDNDPLNARAEIETNYLSAVNLTTKLLPVLKQQAEAAVINISSIVAFVPGISLPTYSASKAALHSYTQILRLTLSQSSKVKVFEVMPPLVDTDFAKDILSDSKISPAEVATALIESFEANTYEVHVAFTQQLYSLFLTSPEKALLALNKIEN